MKRTGSKEPVRFVFHAIRGNVYQAKATVLVMQALFP